MNTVANVAKRQRARLQRMEAAKVESWNAKVRPGDPVIYRNEFGKEHRTRTRSAAELLSGHTAVVWIEDRATCVALDRVRAVGKVGVRQ